MLLFISLKNILFILGVILLLRFIGKMMSARRNIRAQQEHQHEQTRQKEKKIKAQRDLGKTSIHKVDKNLVNDSDYTAFEEVD